MHSIVAYHVTSVYLSSVNIQNNLNGFKVQSRRYVMNPPAGLPSDQCRVALARQLRLTVS